MVQEPLDKLQEGLFTVEVEVEVEWSGGRIFLKLIFSDISSSLSPCWESPGWSFSALQYRVFVLFCFVLFLFLFYHRQYLKELLALKFKS